MPRKPLFALITLAAAFGFSGAALAYDPLSRATSYDPYAGSAQQGVSGDWYDVDPNGRPLSGNTGSPMTNRQNHGYDNRTNTAGNNTIGNCGNIARDLQAIRARIQDLARRYVDCTSSNRPREDCNSEFTALKRIQGEHEDAVSAFSRNCSQP